MALMPKSAVKDLLATQPLYFATSFGITSLVRKLLETDSNLDIEAPGGRVASSPLQVACFRGLTATVKLLLEANADPMSRNQAGTSCLFWATFWRHSEISELLQSYCATFTNDDRKRLDRTAIKQGKMSRKDRFISTEHQWKSTQLTFGANFDFKIRGSLQSRLAQRKLSYVTTVPERSTADSDDTNQSFW